MQQTQRQVAYKHIRSQLAIGAVKQGQRLSENRFARDLGMSRIPVREAISQLTCEGLVRKIPGAGIFVPQLSQDEFYELFDLREMLECYAVEKVASRTLEPEFARELRQRVQRLCEIARAIRDHAPASPEHVLYSEWTLADVHFHRTILRASHCPRMEKIVADTRILTLAISFLRRRTDEPLLTCLARAIREHWRIYRAVIKQQPQAARRLMAEHVQKSKETALAALAKGFFTFQAEELSETDF